MLCSVTKTVHQLSVTVSLTPLPVLWDMEQSVISRHHGAREREMLYRLGVTGCGSRVALSEMLRGFAKSVTRAPLQISPEVLVRGPDLPNVPVCSYCCRVAVIFASVPIVFGRGPNMVVKDGAAGPEICFSVPVSSDCNVFP